MNGRPDGMTDEEWIKWVRDKYENEQKEKGALSNGHDPEDDDETADIICEPLAPLPIHEIPPRPWAYGTFLLFGEVAAIGAVDGGGKGTLAVAVALSMITGRALLGERVWRTGPVAVITYEDKEIEWRRRIAAACLHYDVDYDTVIKNFYFIKRRGEHRAFKISFGAPGPDGDVIFPHSHAIIRHLKEIGAVLLIVDPFNHAHGLPDGNNNALMAQVGHEIARVAEVTNVAALVLHHLRKGAVGDPDDFMGATSLRATFRAVRILTRMRPEDGEKLKISHPEVRRYFRNAGSKENYAPPPEFTTWYRLASVSLGNAAGIYEDGDNVGVATVFTPPDVFEGIGLHALSEIFEALRSPPVDPEKGDIGLRWSSDIRSDEWVGSIIVNKTAKDASETSKIIHAWTQTGVLLEKGTYRHPKRRKERGWVILNEAKAAEILREYRFEADTE